MTAADERQPSPLPVKLSAEEAALARTAQQALLAAPASARGASITIECDDVSLPAIQLPPQALPFIAQMLGFMGERRHVVISSMSQELSTFAAARYLNVSRPFVIKEIEAGRLKHRMVGTHRRIDFHDLQVYEMQMKERREELLQAMADQLDDLGIAY